MRRRDISREHPRLVPIVRIGLTALLLLACRVAAAMNGSAIIIGGPFTLTAADGSTVTDRTYGGKWLLVYFGYTFCPSTCPTTLMTIAAALGKLGPKAAAVQPIFITVDPQRDTAKILGEYTSSFDPRIVGLTGSPDQITAAEKAYGVYAVIHRTGPGADNYVIDHSSYVYLMDPRGAFVRGFEADTSAERIAEVLRDLMAQPRHH